MQSVQRVTSFRNRFPTPGNLSLLGHEIAAVCLHLLSCKSVWAGLVRSCDDQAKSIVGETVEQRACWRKRSPFQFPHRIRHVI